MKERFKPAGASMLFDAFGNRYMMRVRRLHQALLRTDHGAGSWLGCPEDKSANPCLQKGAATHHAGFEGNVKCGVVQSKVSEASGRFSKCDHLGVCRRVAICHGPVMPFTDDGSVKNDQSTHGDLISGHGGIGQSQRLAHELPVEGEAIKGRCV